MKIMMQQQRLTKFDPLYQPEHRRPITRRELVAQGFIGGLAFCSAPTLLGLFAARTPEAFAISEECRVEAGAGAGNTDAAHLTIDCAGGIKFFARNFLVGGQGGTTDTAGFSDGAWVKNGIAAGGPGVYNDNQNVNEDFTIKMHSMSKMLEGMLAKTSPEARARVNGFPITCPSENDTGGLPMNTTHMVAQAHTGSLMQICGRRTNQSGGRASAAGALDSIVAVGCRNENDLANLMDAGIIETLLPSPQARDAYLAATTKLYEANKGNLNLEEARKQILQCAYEQAEESAKNANDPNDLRVSMDPDFGGATGAFSDNDLNDGTKSTLANVLKMILADYSASGTIEIGGCDYHGRGRDTQDERDLLTGECIGLAIEMAHRKGRKLFIDLISDGAVSARAQDSEDGLLEHRSDNEATSGRVVICYDPAGRPETVGNGQLGNFDGNGNANRGLPSTSSLLGGCQASFLAYCVMNGKEAMFQQYLSGLGMQNVLGSLDASIRMSPVAGSNG